MCCRDLQCNVLCKALDAVEVQLRGVTKGDRRSATGRLALLMVCVCFTCLPVSYALLSTSQRWRCMAYFHVLQRCHAKSKG